MIRKLTTSWLHPVLLAVAVCASLCMSEVAWAQPGCGQCGCVGTPAPLGTYSHMWQCGQIRSAHKMLSIHECDWISDSDELSPFMKRYLISHMTGGPRWCGQIAVEPSGDRSMDEQRRLAVVDYLTQHSFAIPLESVTVAYGTRDRLRGDDANHVLDNFGFQRNQTQSQQFNPYVGVPSAFGNSTPTYGRGPLLPGVGAFMGQ